MVIWKRLLNQPPIFLADYVSRKTTSNDFSEIVFIWMKYQVTFVNIKKVRTLVWIKWIYFVFIIDDNSNTNHLIYTYWEKLQLHICFYTFWYIYDL